MQFIRSIRHSLVYTQKTDQTSQPEGGGDKCRKRDTITAAHCLASAGQCISVCMYVQC